MRVQDVHSALESVEKGERPDQEQVEYLQDKGLVDVMPDEEYESQREVADEREVISEELKKYEDAKSFLDNRTDNLESRINSISGAVKDILTLNRSDRKNRYEKLSELQEMVEEDIISPAESEIEDKEALAAELDDYVDTGLGYVDVSDEGEYWMREIEVREGQIDDTEFEEFSEDVESFYDRIDDRYERFLEMLELFEEDGFDEIDSRVTDAALSLSLVEGDLEEVYERAMKVNSWFYEHDWGSYDRLKVVSKLAAQEGDIDEIIEEFDEIYDEMLEDDHSANYRTLLEAAQLREAEGGSTEEKYERFRKIEQELEEQGWSERSAVTCHIASKLAQREGSPEELAEEHYEVDSATWDEFSESAETGVAALALMRGNADLEQQVARFEDTYDLMKDVGWNDRKEFYPAAAAASLMPGTVENNVHVLDRVTEKMKDDGFKNVTRRAIPLVTGAYQDTLQEAFSEEEISRLREKETERDTLQDDILLETAIIYAPLVLEALDSEPSMGMEEMSSFDVMDDFGMDTGFDSHDFGTGTGFDHGTGIDTGVGGGMDMGGGGVI